ncbi:hypothetical protein P308_04225 [Pseudomonas piscis]|nr:hypothetical protein P308_04225 [Pseudomonas piscis]
MPVFNFINGMLWRTRNLRAKILEHGAVDSWP